MLKPVKIRYNDDTIVFIKYSDGLEGYIDLKHTLTKHAIEKILSLRIDDKTSDIILNDSVHLCKDAIYRIVKLKKSVNNIGLPFE